MEMMHGVVRLEPYPSFRARGSGQAAIVFFTASPASPASLSKEGRPPVVVYLWFLL